MICGTDRPLKAYLSYEIMAEVAALSNCKHEKDLRYVYLFARCGWGNTVTFTCRECSEKVTEKFSPDGPYRNWSTPNYEQAWDNVGGPRRPEIQELLESESPVKAV